MTHTTSSAVVPGVVGRRGDPPEPPRDPRYPTRLDDPRWRAWALGSEAPLFAPPGRPPVDGRPGPTPQVTVRLPGHLRARAVDLARWRRTTLAALVREALEHYLDEGVGGRARLSPRSSRYGRSSGSASAAGPGRGQRPASPGGAGAGVADVELRAELVRAYRDGDAGSVADER